MIRNPILTALAPDLTAQADAADPETTQVIICCGSREFRGTLRNDKRWRFEGYYRCGASAPYGPCISAPFAASDVDALRILASAIIGPKPKAGQVAKLAAELPTRCTVSLRQKSAAC